MSTGGDSFEWDDRKNEENIRKHNISFYEAQAAFLDPRRIIAIDFKHSTKTEQRFYCIGQASGGIITTRFTYRNNRIRIIGAGFWRKGRKEYEQQN